MREPRHIVGRTDHMGIAELAARYLNERFLMLGAIVELSGRPRDCKYLVLCEGPRSISVRESSVIVEACRAYITATEAGKEGD